MTPKRILAAFDGSKDADEAFETAVDLAAVCGARLPVVSVATPPEPPTRVETAAALDAATSRRVVAHAPCSVLVVRRK